MKLKKFTFDKLKIIKKLFASKAVIGSVLLAVALWSYTSLSDTYISLVKLPLIINLPEDRAIEVNPPERISIEVRGSGWEIFNLLFFNTAAKVEIDLQKTKIRDSIYRINRNDIIKNVFHLTNLQAIDVVPQQIVLYTGSKISKEVDVISNLKINPKEGFIVIGEQQLSPGKITISGNKKIIDDIENWRTKHTVIKDVFSDFQINVPLQDTMQNIVELSRSRVLISAEIQQAAEMVFYDIPVKINGGSLPDNHLISPSIIRVKVRSGIEELDSLLPDQIEATIDFGEIINDRTGYIKPDIKVPENIDLIGMEPDFIHHKKIVKTKGKVKDKERYF